MIRYDSFWIRYQKNIFKNLKIQRSKKGFLELQCLSDHFHSSILLTVLILITTTTLTLHYLVVDFFVDSIFDSIWSDMGRFFQFDFKKKLKNLNFSMTLKKKRFSRRITVSIGSLLRSFRSSYFESYYYNSYLALLRLLTLERLIWIAATKVHNIEV